MLVSKLYGSTVIFRDYRRTSLVTRTQGLKLTTGVAGKSRAREPSCEISRSGVGRLYESQLLIHHITRQLLQLMNTLLF